MSSSSFIANLNINLVVPVFLIFIIMRTKSMFNIAMRLLSGLRFFTQQRFAAPKKPPVENPTPSDILEKSIAQLNLTMMELDNSVASRYVLTTQLFFDLFEGMVNLGIGAVLAYAWAMGYHCAVPTAVPSCWVVLLLLAFAAFTFQCLLQIVTMTGWRARESKMAAIAGLITFLVSAVLFYFHVSYISQDTVEAIAQHTNALLMQLSRDISPISLKALVPAVQVALSIVAGLIATGLVIPSIRYSQALEVMNFGARAALVSTADKALLWVDFVLPLFVGLLFSPLPTLAAQLLFPKYALPSGPGAESFSNALLTAQLVLGFVMLVVRLLCMKKHLQCFLDSVVRVVSAHLIAVGQGHQLDQTMLLPRVKACTDYLMAAATQFLAVPLFSVAMMLLLHKTSPTGTGMCYTAHCIARLDQAPLLSSILAATQANSTAIAVEAASKPYLSAVLGALASVQMGSAASSYTGPSPSDAVNQFAVKLSTIYALPAGPAMSLCKSIICLQSLLWFLFCLASLLAWTYQPTALVGGSALRVATTEAAVKASKQD